jgi:hypothetical protein
MRFWQRLETEHIERCAGNVAGLDEGQQVRLVQYFAAPR